MKASGSTRHMFAKYTYLLRPPPSLCGWMRRRKPAGRSCMLLLCGLFVFLQVAPPSKKGASSLWARSGAEQTAAELVSHSQCGEISDQSSGCSHRNVSPAITCGNNSQRMSNARWGCSFIQAWTWNLCGTPWLCVGWKKRRRKKKTEEMNSSGSDMFKNK